MIDQENTVIIANLKAYHTGAALVDWIKRFSDNLTNEQLQNKTIIVCPPVSHALLFHEKLKTYTNVFIGVQDISQFGQGAFTGEVTGNALFGCATFTLLGHSERRENQHETHELIQEKIKTATFFGMHSIVCVTQPEQFDGSIWGYAYEPKQAIGTGKPESAQNAKEMLTKIKETSKAQHYIYGGSVNATNIKEYIAVGYSGVLVGTASKDPIEFLSVIRAA